MQLVCACQQTSRGSIPAPIALALGDNVRDIYSRLVEAEQKGTVDVVNPSRLKDRGGNCYAGLQPHGALFARRKGRPRVACLFCTVQAIAAVLQAGMDCRAKNCCSKDRSVRREASPLTNAKFEQTAVALELSVTGRAGPGKTAKTRSSRSRHASWRLQRKAHYFITQWVCCVMLSLSCLVARCSTCGNNMYWSPC